VLANKLIHSSICEDYCFSVRNLVNAIFSSAFSEMFSRSKRNLTFSPLSPRSPFAPISPGSPWH